VLRRMTESDLPRIVAILAEPEVARWWGTGYDVERVRRDHLQDPGSETYAIDVEGELAGLLLVSEENDPEYRHAGLDISLATAFQGGGV
jgi:aminoglycoside 6'-N-acetyltransferase